MAFYGHVATLEHHSDTLVCLLFFSSETLCWKIIKYQKLSVENYSSQEEAVYTYWSTAVTFTVRAELQKRDIHDITLFPQHISKETGSGFILQWCWPIYTWPCFVLNLSRKLFYFGFHLNGTLPQNSVMCGSTYCISSARGWGRRIMSSSSLYST